MGMEPVGITRKFGKGVCVLNAIAPPQCESNTPHTQNSLEMAGKQVNFLKQIQYPPKSNGMAIATAAAVSSKSTNPLAKDREPRREARNFDEGVCVWDTLIPP